MLIYLNRAGKTVLLSTATSLAQGPLWLMATNDALYQALFKAYTDAHPTKPKGGGGGGGGGGGVVT